MSVFFRDVERRPRHVRCDDWLLDMSVYEMLCTTFRRHGTFPRHHGLFVVLETGLSHYGAIILSRKSFFQNYQLLSPAEPLIFIADCRPTRGSWKAKGKP